MLMMNISSICSGGRKKKSIERAAHTNPESIKVFFLPILVATGIAMITPSKLVA